MFDIGFWEISLIAIIALMVLGPERLPRVARTAGLWIGKMKRMVSDVKTSIDEELRMEDLKAIKQAGEDLKDGLQSTQDELKTAGGQFQKSVEEAAEEAETKVDIASAINQSAPRLEPDASPAVNPAPVDRKVAQDVGSKSTKKKMATKKANTKKSTKKVNKKIGKKATVKGNGASRKTVARKSAAGKKKKPAKKTTIKKETHQGARRV